MANPITNFTVRAINGDIIPEAEIHVLIPNTSTHITGLETVEETPMTNPFTVDLLGQRSVRAPVGEYDIRIVGGGQDKTYRYTWGATTDVPLVLTIDTITANVFKTPIITATIDSNDNVILDASLGSMFELELDQDVNNIVVANPSLAKGSNLTLNIVNTGAYEVGDWVTDDVNYVVYQPVDVEIQPAPNTDTSYGMIIWNSKLQIFPVEMIEL